MSRTHQTSPTPRGSERRRALLEALESLLAERPLSDIEIGHIAQRAGVARSGFYFYFPTKGAAVAALLEGLFDETIAVGSGWLTGRDSSPADRLRTGLGAMVALWEQQALPLVAMLDAAGSDLEVRRLWESWLDGFIPRVADRIREEQEAGLALSTIEPTSTAGLLLGMNLYALERHVRKLVTDGTGTPDLARSISDIWIRSIYGTDA